MADDSASFAVVLEDKTSGAAASAASALESLQNSIKRDTKALGEMQAAMKRMQSGTSVNVEAFRELQGRIEKQKQGIADAQAKFVSLGGQFGRTSKSTKTTADRMKELGDKARQLPGPIGKLGGGIADMAGKMGTGSMVALGLAAAFIAVGVAVLGAVASMLKFGLASANARRSEGLHFEAISRMRRGLVGMRASSDEVVSAIDRVSGSTATSRENVSRFAEILQRGGVRGEALTTALRAASVKAAALGDSAGESFARMAVGARRSGVSINRLAADIQARFGGIAARRMLDMNVQAEKLHENFASIFAGLNVEPILRVFNTITGLFSQNEATGRALKAIVTALFQPLIDQAGNGTPIIKRFFQGIILAALKTAIVIVRVRNWFREAFANFPTTGIDKAKVALYAGAVAFGVIALAAGAAAILIGAAIFAIVSPFLIVGFAISKVVQLFSFLTTAGEQLGDDWAEIGPRLIDGLVNGITGGIRRAVAAVRTLGHSLIDEWRSLLDIHSPSRVFASLGAQIPAGVEVGVDAGSDGANSAVRDMIDVPGSLGAGGGGSRSITIGEIHVHTAATDAASIANEIRNAIAQAFDGISIEMGVAGAV